MVQGTLSHHKKRPSKDDGPLTASIHFNAHKPLKKNEQNRRVSSKRKCGKKQSADKQNERELKASLGWKTKKIEEANKH